MSPQADPITLVVGSFSDEPSLLDAVIAQPVTARPDPRDERIRELEAQICALQNEIAVLRQPGLRYEPLGRERGAEIRQRMLDDQRKQFASGAEMYRQLQWDVRNNCPMGMKPFARLRCICKCGDPLCQVGPFVEVQV
jgi:hypothetical protein